MLEKAIHLKWEVAEGDIEGETTCFNWAFPACYIPPEYGITNGCVVFVDFHWRRGPILNMNLHRWHHVWSSTCSLVDGALLRLLDEMMSDVCQNEQTQDRTNNTLDYSAM